MTYNDHHTIVEHLETPTEHCSLSESRTAFRSPVYLSQPHELPHRDLPALREDSAGWPDTMGAAQPYMYSADQRSDSRFPEAPFDPRAVTRASWEPKPKKPQQNGPFISFNRHPE